MKSKGLRGEKGASEKKETVVDMQVFKKCRTKSEVYVLLWVGGRSSVLAAKRRLATCELLELDWALQHHSSISIKTPS